MYTSTDLTKTIVRLMLIALCPHLIATSQDVKFDRIGTDKGLTQANVTAIEQDDLGYIWLGTEDGLNRYNGYHETDPKPLSPKKSRRMPCVKMLLTRIGKKKTQQRNEHADAL